MPDVTETHEAEIPRPPLRTGYVATAAIWGITALLLWLPYAWIASALDELFGYGWPGRWRNDMSKLNGTEELGGLVMGSALAAAILVVASVVVAVNARATRTRPVLSSLVGLAVIVAAGIALFPIMVTPTGQL